MDQKLHVFVRTYEPQHDSYRNWESSPRRIAHDFGRRKLIFLAASIEFAPACGEHVLHPFRLAAVGEGNGESIGRSKDVDRSSVDLARFATHVRENAEAGKPACEQAGDAIRGRDVDLRQPSLAKPHHQDSCGGDDDCDDGSDAHSSLAFHNGIRFDLNQPIRGSIKRTTCMMVLAGRIVPKNSPWTAATGSQSSMRVSNIRVRVTSESLPPSPSIADWMISRHLRA